MLLTDFKEKSPIVYYFTCMGILYVIFQCASLFFNLYPSTIHSATVLPFAPCLIILTSASHNQKHLLAQNRILIAALFILFVIAYEFSYLSYLHLSIDYLNIIFAYGLLLVISLLIELLRHFSNKSERYVNWKKRKEQRTDNKENGWLRDRHANSILYMLLLIIALPVIILNLF